MSAEVFPRHAGRRAVCLAALVCAIAATPIAAQEVTGTIYGKVADVITKVWNTDLKPEDAQTQLIAAIGAKQ